MKNTTLNKILGIVLTIMVSALAIFWLVQETPLLSPLSETPLFQFLPTYEKGQNQNRIIYGFAPFWYLDKITLQPEITHLAYFSLTIGPEGNFLTRNDQGGEPGFAKLSSDSLLDLNNQLKKEKSKNRKLDLVAAQLNNADIEDFLASPSAHIKFLNSLDSILLAYPFNGINLDIEYTGNASPELRQQMTKFVKDVREHLNKKYDGIELTIDMYAGAANKNMIWDVAEIAPNVDYIVVMAYDFHRSSSQIAGPIAPLFDADASWKESINKYLKAFTENAPQEKILLGIPFYGYEWRTTEKKPGALTYPGSGAIASYKRVLEILEDREILGVEEHWDETALSPFITYTKDGKNYTITYENARSLSYKLEYVNQLDLGGIAIWSLGYEGDNRDLWDVINKKIGN